MDSSDFLDLIEESEVTPEQDAEIRRLLCTCFPERAETFRSSRAWHGSRPAFTVIATSEAGDVIAHVAIVLREVLCMETRRVVPVAGVQGVAVDPDYRKTGLSQAILRRAMDRAARRHVRFGMLFCRPELERFYQTMGWRRLEQPVTMWTPRGAHVPITHEHVAMVSQLADEVFPPGPIDLRGPDW